jgi:hypothetical protein
MWYSEKFLAERTLNLGLPAGLLWAVVLFLFVLVGEAAKEMTSTIRKGMVGDMTKLLKSILEALNCVRESARKVICATVWAVGAEITAACSCLYRPVSNCVCLRLQF